MRFKVGDKVKYVPQDPYFDKAYNRTGIILSINPDSHFPYQVVWNPGGLTITMLESELVPHTESEGQLSLL